MKCPNHEIDDVISSSSIGYCGNCISEMPYLIDTAIQKHRRSRIEAGLVNKIPSSGDIVCSNCGNHCRMNNGDIGFCQLRKAIEFKIAHRYSDGVPVSWYFDPLPTNCVADWVCPATHHSGNIELHRGKKNLAAFYGSCSSDCLFCQNSSFRRMMSSGTPRLSPHQLADVADANTACICFFGGDPSCNSEHSLKTAQLLLENHDIRVCYETNGNISRKWLFKIADLVRDSGGTIKIDLKARTPSLYRALTGISNQTVVNNFAKLAEYGKELDSAFLVASILLIPGYVGLREVRELCEFIVEQDANIPTALLGFMPHFHMQDLPRTSSIHAEMAVRIAKETGLENVRIGNQALLSDAEYDYR